MISRSTRFSIEGSTVTRGPRDREEWTGIASQLKERNAPIGLRIRNEQGIRTFRVDRAPSRAGIVF
jgi:hypothetical protein